MENEKKTGDKYSKLAGNTLIFAISSFSSKLLTLIVQPFLTYAMAEISDLGLSKILSQYANLLIPFVSMGMSNAIIRFGLDKGNSEKQVFTNGLLTILGGFGILVLCWPVTQFLPDMAQYGLLIYIYVLMSCLRTLCTQFVRSRQWNKLVAVDGVLCTVATMAFYVLYLVGFKWGANGYLLAIISGDLTSVLFLLFTGKLWNYVELKGVNKKLWRQMLNFSLPMIPAQISFWIINASDLFFVREMCEGLDERTGNAWSGLLSTGYFLPTILTTLGLIFYDAWQLSAVTEEEERARFFTKIFRTYSSVLFCCAAGIIWLCRPVMHVMKSNYYYAWHFVPFLVLASTCSCFNQFMNSVYVVTKKSQRSMVTMMAGAISNCIMNYFFIKLWGPVGATYASFLGLALVFTLRAVDARRMIGMRVHPARVLTGISILWFLVPGYVFAISISFVVPKLFTAIAFDAGGVASGPMTATFLLPLAQGACVAVGGNIVTDAFGVVAMVAMTPLITVQMMGLVAQLRTRKARTAQPAAVLATVFADLPDDAIIEL